MSLLKTLLPPLLLILLTDGVTYHVNQLEPVPDLDLSEILGTWYMLFSDEEQGFKRQDKCMQYTYSDNRDGTLNLTGKGISIKDDEAFSSSFQVTFEKNEKNQTTGRSMVVDGDKRFLNADIVYFDSKRFLISYSRRAVSDGAENYEQTLIVMTRDRPPRPQIEFDAKKWINKFCVKLTKATKMDHSNCKAVY